MSHTPYTGVFPALTTPFTESLAIDHQQLADDVRRLEAAGVDGLVPVGTTGESATLTHDEHVAVIETVVETATDVPVIAGAGSNATHEALDLAGRAANAGADGLLLISPYYNNPEPAGMEEHFRTIADGVDLPQIVYNVPSRTGRSMAIETVRSLASHENVVGYKAASGDTNRITEIIEHTRAENFAVLSGDDAMTVPLCSIGASGCISVGANVVPARLTTMVHAALDGDFETARTHHHELGELFRLLFIETNPIPVVAAMDYCGHAPERVRPPLSTLSDEHRSALESALDSLEPLELPQESSR